MAALSTAAFATLGLAAVPPPAEESPPQAGLVWTLDPNATEIHFEVAATLHTVHGTAKLRRATLTFGPAAGTVQGEIVIDARSLDTGNDKRDRNLHTSVLESERFQTIVLRPLRFEGDLLEATTTVRVEAEIELHGASHLIQFDALVTQGESRMTVSTRFEIPYVAWGLEDPSKAFLRVAKTVQVELTAAGSLTESAVTDDSVPGG